jgi:hypothetical protein
VKHAKAGRILARRQELPEEAFISVEELEQMFGWGNHDGVLPIIAISFCWLTPSHPDPAGAQLQIIASVLERELPKYAMRDSILGLFDGFQDMGVFWDVRCSLHLQTQPKYGTWKGTLHTTGETSTPTFVIPLCCA